MIVWPKGGDYSFLTSIDDIRFSDSKTVQFNALTGGSIGQIAAEYTLGDFPSKTVKWLHYDRLGSVMNKSGSAGTLTDTYHQDAYGNLISNITTGQWASSMSGRHLTTKEYDDDANLYYFWQRWYDPQVGRFISRDQFPSVNPYVFTLNNPVLAVDPTGNLPNDPGFPPMGEFPDFPFEHLPDLPENIKCLLACNMVASGVCALTCLAAQLAYWQCVIACRVAGGLFCYGLCNTECCEADPAPAPQDHPRYGGPGGPGDLCPGDKY